MTAYRFLQTPIGELLLAGDGERLAYIGLPKDGRRPAPPAGGQEDPRMLGAAARQLDEYFAGTRRVFELELAPQGTPFQQCVWSALLDIPYGTTWSYGELARMIGRPAASRAVGAANGSNPIPIIIPCHRVIGSNGKLTGYGGGLDIKARLLDLERCAHGVADLFSATKA